MYLKITTLVALVTVSSLTMAADKKEKKAFEATEKSCAKLVKMIDKSAGNEKKLKGLNKKKAICDEAGF